MVRYMTAEEAADTTSQIEQTAVQFVDGLSVLCSVSSTSLRIGDTATMLDADSHLSIRLEHRLDTAHHV